MKITVGQLSVIADYFSKMTDDRNDKVNITVTDIGLLFETETVKASVAFNNRPEPVVHWVTFDGFSVPDLRGMNEIEVEVLNGATAIFNADKNFTNVAWPNVRKWRRTK